MKNNNYQYLSLEDIFLQFVSIICLIVHLSTIFCRTIESPLPQQEMKDIPNNQCLWFVLSIINMQTNTRNVQYLESKLL